MTAFALHSGPMAPPSHVVVRSGLRWLCNDGYRCRAMEPIAFCTIGVVAAGASGAHPFGTERFDLQIAFASPAGGIVRPALNESPGGMLDRLGSYRWDDGFPVAHIENADADGDETRQAELMMLTGRRMTDVAGSGAGLLTGWHSRGRAWWGDGDEADMLLGLGGCELTSTIRGERDAFAELFEATAGPAQIATFPDEPLLASARIVLEQAQRDETARTAIKEDFARTFTHGPIVPQPEDILFGGALLEGICRTPLSGEAPRLTRTGIRETRPARAIAMSLNTDLTRVARHKRLGYTISAYTHRLERQGAASLAWLRENFEPVTRTVDDIACDYAALADFVARENGATLFIFNRFSTQAYENIHHYAGFDLPLGDTLRSVHARELNLMLHDLARRSGIEIVDIDAIAADMGMRTHLPDGVHPSGPLSAEIREELLFLLRRRGFAGFAARR